jgi:hypothetical protein
MPVVLSDDFHRKYTSKMIHPVLICDRLGAEKKHETSVNNLVFATFDADL